MIKISAILLSSFLFVQSALINFDDFVQLEDLVGHFQFHSKTFGDNLFEFFSKHYGDLRERHENDKQHEKKQHEKLPFNHDSFAHSSSDFVLEYQEFTTLLPVAGNQQNSKFYYTDFHSSFEKQKIFQPPRKK